ncbi:hypothetical protein JCM15124A_05290 [Prevotella falsenii]
MAMLLTSCHKDAELTPEQEKTIAVRKLYYERVLGQWYYEEQDELSYRYVSYNFKEKGKLETHEKTASRKRIKDGEKVNYSDWEVKTDTITKGSWSLGWKEEYGEMYLSTSKEDGYGHSVVEYHGLGYVSKNELVLKYFGTGTYTMLFKRVAPIPSI